MAALMGFTSLTSRGMSNSLTSTSASTVPSSPPSRICLDSSLRGNQLPVNFKVASRRVDSAPYSYTVSSLPEQAVSKRSTAVECLPASATASLSSSDFDSDDAKTSLPSPFSKAVADAKAWKASRASKRTTRRRALALCLALATVSRHGAGQEQVQAATTLRNQDLISVTSSTRAQIPVAIPTRWEGYGNLVTVSTGSSNSSNNGSVKGLPSWMAGNYNLCLGDGFHLQLPSDWHMHDTQGIHYDTVLRYEDKGDPSTNVIVLKSPTTQSRTTDLGNPEDWIREQAYLLTGSNEPLQFQLSNDEGEDAAQKFPGGRVSIAKVLNVNKPENKQGLTYYNYEIVTKQGGKQADSLHELVAAVINDGNLYMCRVQTVEGKWESSTKTVAQKIVDSFQITGFKVRA